MLPLLLDFNGLQIFSYPLFIGLAWGLAFRLAEAELPSGIRPRSFIVWSLGLFLATWVGAKVFFIFTQDRWTTTELVEASNFWLGGGFVFLGGFIAGAIYTLIVGLVLPQFSHREMQFTLVPLLWGHAVGRIGCFLAGCCYGRETDLPWAIHLHGLDRHPVQLYEAVSLAALAWILSHIKRTKLLPAYLLAYGGLRWCLEWFRGDELRGSLGGQSSSQWVSLFMVAIGLILYVCKHLKSRNPA